MYHDRRCYSNFVRALFCKCFHVYKCEYSYIDIRAQRTPLHGCNHDLHTETNSEPAIIYGLQRRTSREEKKMRRCIAWYAEQKEIGL